MASDLVRFSVTIPQTLLTEFDAYAARRGTVANRSEALRDLMREKLVEEDLRTPEEEVVGSITMVYDHHTPDLTRKLDEIQHAYIHEIVSAMHVHLDHNNCLEIIAVRGKGEAVYRLADCLLGVKGVAHGQLTCTATAGVMRAAQTHAHGHDHHCGHDHQHDHHCGHDHPRPDDSQHSASVRQS
jgi:CopG family nickel-responsive transcriptional regulator